MRTKKEYDFIVTLKHQDYKIFDVITVLLCVMTLAALVFAIMNTGFVTYNWVSIFLAAFIIINFFIIISNRNKKETIPTFKWSLFAAAFLWLLYPLHIPAISIFFIIAALLERQ